MRKWPIVGVALAATAVVVLVAGVPVSRLLPWLLVLACPLMMLFMHRGSHDHGGHGSHGGQPTESREEVHPTK